MDTLEPFMPLLMVLLGWFLGLLTPGIAEKIRRPYRRRDLMRAVVDEMLSLQYIMMHVAYLIRSRRGDASDSFFDEAIPIAQAYQGIDREESLVEAMKRIRAVPVETRAQIDKAAKKSNSGLTLREYAMPLVATQIPELAICDVEFQRAILNIKHYLDVFNQFGPQAHALFKMTFDKPTPEDRERLVDNQEQLYKNAGRQAEIIMRAISELRERYG